MSNLIKLVKLAGDNLESAKEEKILQDMLGRGRKLGLTTYTGPSSDIPDDDVARLANVVYTEEDPEYMGWPFREIWRDRMEGRTTPEAIGDEVSSMSLEAISPSVNNFIRGARGLRAVYPQNVNGDYYAGNQKARLDQLRNTVGRAHEYGAGLTEKVREATAYNPDSYVMYPNPDTNTWYNNPISGKILNYARGTALPLQNIIGRTIGPILDHDKRAFPMASRLADKLRVNVADQYIQRMAKPTSSEQFKSQNDFLLDTLPHKIVRNGVFPPSTNPVTQRLYTTSPKTNIIADMYDSKNSSVLSWITGGNRKLTPEARKWTGELVNRHEINEAISSEGDKPYIPSRNTLQEHSIVPHTNSLPKKTYSPGPLNMFRGHVGMHAISRGNNVLGREYNMVKHMKGEGMSPAARQAAEATSSIRSSTGEYPWMDREARTTVEDPTPISEASMRKMVPSHKGYPSMVGFPSIPRPKFLDTVFPPRKRDVPRPIYVNYLKQPGGGI